MEIVWDVYSEQWENNFCLLVKFQQREGHSNVPKSHIEDWLKLGKWLSTQHKQEKKEKPDLSLKKWLEYVGVVWGNIYSKQLKDNYGLLLKFQQKKGHSNIPTNHIEDDMKLGEWLNKQWQEKKKVKREGSHEKWLKDVEVVWDVIQNIGRTTIFFLPSSNEGKDIQRFQIDTLRMVQILVYG